MAGLTPPTHPCFNLGMSCGPPARFCGAPPAQVPHPLPEASLAAAAAAHPHAMQTLQQLLQQRPVWPAAALHEAVAAAGGGSSSSGRYPVDDLLPKLCYKFRNGARAAGLLLGWTGRGWSCLLDCCLGRAQHWCRPLCVIPYPHHLPNPAPPTHTTHTTFAPPTHPPAGPWKNAWTQRGYDPRTSPAARQWQCVEYHLPSEW